MPPFISIIVPCRNEQKFIGACLESIIGNGYPLDRLEVLVVDGMSEDGTREAVRTITSRHPFIRILDNPLKITPRAFNIGIENARGDLVMIMSAHATYGRGAIGKCAEYSQSHQADNVGGVWKIHPRGDGWFDKLAAAALSNRFGVGGAHYRVVTDDEPRWVDTVAYGCYKREVFRKIGTFNEKLVRGQDMELNKRLKAAGGTILLVPDVVIHYYARSNFVSFGIHNFRNGLWAILPFAHSKGMPVSLRHLIPMAFVMGLLGAGIGGLFWRPLGWFFVALCAAYGLAAAAASLRLAMERKDARYFLLMPFVFASLHVCYGLGSLYGIVRILTGAHKLCRPLDSSVTA